MPFAETGVHNKFLSAIPGINYLCPVMRDTILDSSVSAHYTLKS